MLLDRYEISKRISGGGFGEVLLGEDVRLSRKVAIKKMECCEETRNEMTILKSLKCSGMPEVYDYLEEENVAYLIMEYVDGITLRQYLLENGAMSENQAAKRIMEIIDILRVLHSAKPTIIYRDLKPENIMLTNSGELKLIDFGAAFKNDYGRERKEGAFGTKGYSAPELWRGTVATVESDVYSLGAILHEMLTGDSPLEPPYIRRRLKEVDPAFSKGIQDIIDKCLEDNPADRFHSVDEVAKAVTKRNKVGKTEGLIWNLKKIVVALGYILALSSIVTPILRKGVGLIDLWDIQKALISLSLALLLHMILIYRTMHGNQRFKVIKEIFLSEKGYVGLYICFISVVGIVMGLGVLGNSVKQSMGRAYAKTPTEEMWVEMRDTSERYMLLKNDGVYEVEDKVRFEIPKESMPDGEVDLKIVAMGADGQEYESRMFKVANRND